MTKEPKVINVLGTDIRILFRKEKDDPKLESCVGYFDSSKGWIIVKILEPDAMSLGNLDKYQKEILRHEIVHAFLYESGLDACSNQVTNWASNEEMVDWFARMGERIYRAWKDAGALSVEQI